MATPSVLMLDPDGQPWNIPQDKVSDAVAKGGKLAVNMRGPDQKNWVIPMDRVHDAINKGGQLIGAPPPGAPTPSELQPDTGPRRMLETYPQNMVDKLHQMGEVMHDLGTAVSSGDWGALQKKYPPTEPQPTVGGLAQTVGGGYKSGLQSVGLWPEIRRDPRTGAIDPWATVGATLSNATMGALPIAGELRGINEEFPTPIRAAEEAAPEAAAAAEAAAEPKLTLAQRYPKMTTTLAKTAGAGIGGGLGSLVGAPTVGGILGKEIAEQWVRKYTDIPAPEAAPMPTPAAPAEPGATTPLPPRSDAERLADAIVNQYGANIPESDAKVPGHLYRQIQSASPHMPEPLTDAQIRGLAEDVLRPERERVAAAKAAAEARKTAPAAPAAAAPVPPPTATTPAAAPPVTEAAPTPPPTATRPAPTLEETATQPPAEAVPTEGRRTIGEAQAEAYREAQTVKTAPEPPPEALKTYAGTPTTREESAAAWRAWQRGEGPPPPRPAPGQASAEEPIPPIPPEHQPFGGAPGTEVPSVLNPRYTQAVKDNDIVAQMREDLARAPYAEKYTFEQSKGAGFGANNKYFTKTPQQSLNEYNAAVEEMTSKRFAGAPPQAAAKLVMEVGGFLFEGGVRDITEWSKAMVDKLGEGIKPYLDGVWDQLTRVADQQKVQATRKPTGANATEDYTTQPLLTDRSVYDVGQAKGNKPSVLQDYADLVTGKKIPREPLRDDQFRGEPRFANDQEFQDAHADWVKKTTPYVGFKTALTAPSDIVDAFVNHLMDNKRAIWNMIPEHLREEWMQWYDTARTQAIRLGQKTGITNEQGAGLIATQSPQKDWFQNLSLADRMNDIWHGQQDTVTDGKMLKAGRDITDSQTIVQVMKSRILEGRTLAELDSPEVLAKLERSSLPKLKQLAKSDNAAADLQGIWVRLYDEAHNDPSFGTTNALGEDTGLARNQDGSPTPVAWQSTKAVGKGISILKNGKLENILNQLGDQHKVPNFNNNVLAPDHPAGFYTADTHDVAAGLGRPLGSSAVEVDHNFGGSGARSHADTGLSGTYGLHAEAGRQLAAELGILPRQVQSVVWEGGRKLFPDTFKTEKNLAKIDNLWKQYEEGDLTHDQVWQGIFKVRAEAGLDTQTGGVPRDFTLTREQYQAEQAARRDRLASAGTLDRLQSVRNQQELGQADTGGAVGSTRKAPASVGEPQELGQTAPLRAARRAKRQ